jgi:ubiquinol-cytochrome c reductase cytochrome c1 subunit
MKKILLLFSLIFVASGAVIANSDNLEPKEIKWSFDGMFGTFDRASIQRGFQVYKEVCSACHSLHLVAFRNLTEIGFSEAEAKEIAKNYNIPDGPNDSGEMFERPGILSDRFYGPYANEKVARASNNGAYPPDLSLIVRARENGANYIHSLLTGFNQNPPKGMIIQDGMYYNPYFPGMQIAMASPLTDGIVTYTDGTKASVDQMSRDVLNFLQWTADPKMEKRKSMGIKVLLFLAIFTGLFYVAKKRSWSNVD